MQYFTLVIASALVLASQATAQTMPDVPKCLMDCFNEASSTAGCTSGGMDLQCMCTNTAFTKAAMGCILPKCSSDDQAAALTLQNQYCAAFMGNSTNTAAEASASTTATSTPASSASKSAGYSTTANLGLLVAGAGIALFAL